MVVTSSGLEDVYCDPEEYLETDSFEKAMKIIGEDYRILYNSYNGNISGNPTGCVGTISENSIVTHNIDVDNCDKLYAVTIVFSKDNSCKKCIYKLYNFGNPHRAEIKSMIKEMKVDPNPIKK
jgi:hypothetical protein